MIQIHHKKKIIFDDFVCNVPDIKLGDKLKFLDKPIVGSVVIHDFRQLQTKLSQKYGIVIKELIITPPNQSKAANLQVDELNHLSKCIFELHEYKVNNESYILGTLHNNVINNCLISGDKYLIMEEYFAEERHKAKEVLLLDPPTYINVHVY